MKKLGSYLAFAGIMLVLATGASFAQSADTGDTASTAPSSTTNYHPPKTAKTKSSSDGWNGMYVGGYAGFGLRRATANTSTVFTSTGYFASSSVPAIAAS